MSYWRNLSSAVMVLAVSTGIAPSGFAADQEETIEEIVVTGSRIKQSNIDSSAPLTIIYGSDLVATGTTNVADYLSKMPQSIATLNSSNTVFESTISGINVTDLRYLGEDRTLVLVNGRRFVSGVAPGTGYAVDLNAIPTSIIERIEILTGGVSAVYGSDAVAGVVNIITKTDFDGVTFHLQTSETDHDDGKGNDADITIGGQFGEGGHGWVALGYSDDNGLASRDRDFSQFDIIAYDTPLFTPNSSEPKHWGFLGSSFPPAGNYGGFLGDGTPFRIGFDDRENSDAFNRSGFRTLSIPTERRFAAANITYDINKQMSAWMELNWSIVETRATFEPTPLDLNDIIFDSDKFASAAINPVNGLRFCEDPNDDGNNADAMACPAGHDIASSLLMPQLLKDNLLASGFTDLNQLGVNRTGRRLVEFGARGFAADRTTLRVATGFLYELKNGWEYSVFYNFGRTDQSQTDDGLINVERALIAMDVEIAPDGTIQCRSAVARVDGCAPFNPFGEGTITEEAIAYLKAPGSFQATVEQENFGMTLTGATSIGLPGGPLAFAIGYEFREEFGSDQPGVLTILGATSSPKQEPTSGRFDVDEYFAELRLPVFENFEISLAARAGDYSTVGNIGTWMAGLDVRIIDSLRMRATYSESVRAPNISDLFAGAGQTFLNISDVCDNLNPGGTDAVTRNCLSVPAIAARVATTGGFVLTQVERQSTGGFLRGDPNVREETANSFTAGIVWTPGFAKGLSLTIDFYDIQVDDAIANTPRGTIIARCYNVTSDFDRTCGGAARRDATSGALLEVDSPSANENIFKTAGLDVELSYHVELDSWYRKLAGNLDTTLFLSHVTQWDEIGIVSGDVDDDLGEVTRPENRLTGKLSYTHGDWNARFWRLRFWDDVKDSNTGALGNESGGVTLDGTIGTLNELASVWYHDLQINWKFSDNVRVYVGLNNVFDQEPAILGTGTQYGSDGINTARAAYDVYGRTTYFGLRTTL